MFINSSEIDWLMGKEEAKSVYEYVTLLLRREYSCGGGSPSSDPWLVHLDSLEEGLLIGPKKMLAIEKFIIAFRALTFADMDILDRAPFGDRLALIFNRFGAI